MSYQIEPLTAEEMARWDELIAPYASRELFHRRVWLDYLAASRAMDIHLWAIRENGQTQGYFCGGIVRKGPFRILGSPLKGWGTNFMGPLMDQGLDQRKFVKGLDRIAKQHRLAMIELEQRMLSDDVLAAAGYESEISWTYWIELTSDSEIMMRRMHQPRRYGIRRALRSGLIVEESSDSGIADDYYDQFSQIMRRKGLVVPYPREYPRLLLRHLSKADSIFALRVRDASDRILATGLFPYDDTTVFFWGGASIEEGRKLYANDLLHWHAMCLAAERGLQRYDMSGWGRFKQEFGGELITLKRWHKSYLQAARWARRGYARYHKERMRLLGLLDRMFHRYEKP